MLWVTAWSAISARARTLAKVMDRYGVDPLLGLFLPGVGDVIGSVIGLYLVVVAVRHRASPVVIARMLMNLGLDAMAVGAIPVAGDVFDFVFQANETNLALLESRPQGRAKASDWILVFGALALNLAILGFVIYGIVWLFGRILG